MRKPCVIVPNWNGSGSLKGCLDSLRAQTLKPHIIVVDNGSADDSVELVQKHYPDVELIRHHKNQGYAGGVNPGFHRAMELGSDYAAPFNNDAIADKHWLERLVHYLDSNDQAGIAACKLLTEDGQKIDSTGDYYSVWGLPFPRGRGESDTDKYDKHTDIFGASGGASLYRVKMLREIGLFDEDFFAYYEDVDLSFRAQLSGWKVGYVPHAVAYHQIGATSSQLRGFTTYQTLKNLPLLYIKNVPRRYLFRVGWRLGLVLWLFFWRAVSRGNGWPALKGDVMSRYLFFKKLAGGERQRIQKTKYVTDEYIWSIMTHDLPPNAQALRKLRAYAWRLRGKRA